MTNSKNRGADTLAEILSQPDCWEECLQNLKNENVLSGARERIGRAKDLLFIGCGSSYYLAGAAADSWMAITGLPARAIPASELLLFPELVWTSQDCVPVLFSRSGKTSEVVRAAELLERERGLRTLAITCSRGEALERAASSTIQLPPADERSTTMTRSFTSMLLALQFLAADVAGDRAFSDDLCRLPALSAPLFTRIQMQVEEFVSSREFADYVYLGQGALHHIACEVMLKVTEMSCSFAQVFHTLEFRHGPKSIASSSVLTNFLLSESSYQAERDVLEEIAALGAATFVVANRPDSATRSTADLVVELGLDLPEIARLAAYCIPGQLLGHAIGLKKGLDPDKPLHLSRVVVLD